MNLREIRLIESAPNIGAPTFASRRETSSFAVGTDNVVSITLDDAGVVTICAVTYEPDDADKKRPIDHWLVLPFAACKWSKPEIMAPVTPVAKTEPKQTEPSRGRQKAR